MELIKKTIKQALTTGFTETCTGTCRVIIPDLSAKYHMTLLLTSKAVDLGFFDGFEDYGGDYEVYYGDGSNEVTFTPIGINNLT